jgi:hypothetical protein
MKMKKLSLFDGLNKHHNEDIQQNIIYHDNYQPLNDDYNHEDFENNEYS